RTSPGLITTLPPAKACTPSGSGRKPGGSSSALSALGARPSHAARNQSAGHQAQLPRESDGRRLLLIREAQYATTQTRHKAGQTLETRCSDAATLLKLHLGGRPRKGTGACSAD